MQKNSIADKRRLIIDGFELPGLIAVGDITLEKGQLDAPEFKVLRKISNGIKTIPAIECTYKLDRDTESKKFIEDWFNKSEIKDVVCIYTDASGTEYRREIWSKTEIVRKNAPAYDAASPGLMRYEITLLPWDIIEVAS